MSRSTQYIGLTDQAREYVKSAIKVEQWQMTIGMFDEPVMGSIYHLPPPNSSDKELIAKEVVQLEPWSSGPMIFTHLKLTVIDKDGKEVEMGFAYDWVQDFALQCEVDWKKGTYYV